MSVILTDAVKQPDVAQVGTNLNPESFDDLELPGSEHDANLPRVEKSSNERLEKAHEQKELSDEAAKPYRWNGQERWQGKENEAKRKVNPMHFTEFVNRLRLNGVDVWPNTFTNLGRIGLNANVRGIDRTVTTLQYPYSYEWSVMRFDEHNVPTNEKFRGWRTALLALIENGVLTKEKAHAIFGTPSGEVADLYLRQLQNVA